MDDGRGDHLVLIGMMGAGKTTVGRLVAQRLERPFLDSDEVIEARTGRTVREIFAENGEAAFRAEETAALTEAVHGSTPAVIAAAGGAVLAAENRSALRAAGTVVWLRADPATLAARVADGFHRPLIDDDHEAALSALETERRDLYDEVADAIVEVDALTPDQVADRVLAAVEVRA